ncbi:MAG: GNAT family N-acetyltransferase [Chloroflexi bacterium]|nr:GNAT family N-acetyltransferase [Chloroflexota bacterium]
MRPLGEIWAGIAGGPEADGASPVVRPLALGWATVELDRATSELGSLIGEGQIARSAPRSAALGAACQMFGTDDPEMPWVVLLEPDTEGRLAATLARHGEGWAAAWWSGADDARPATPAARIAWSPPRPGPFGPERLLLGGPTTGPHRLTATPATIRAMTDSQISIRAAAAGDAEAIASLFTDEGYPAGSSDIVERLSRFTSTESRVLVAELDGTLLGFLALHAMPRFEHDDTIVRILALVVDAGARERGIGRSLMGEAESIGRELGAAFVEITAGHHRPEARHLYETLGYDANVAAYLRKKL